MKLLKSFGGEEVEMKVVSLLDSTSSMVSANTPSDEEWGGGGGQGEFGLGVVRPPVSHLHNMAGASEAIPFSLSSSWHELALGQREPEN